ncbi:MAG: gluconokinase [Chromatiaceae bacterium]|jgi:gluconokinase
MIILVMGVAGSGKTTVGRRIAERLGWVFVEGDGYHPKSNVAKMGRGEPLTDADREPWLDALGDRISELAAADESAVVTCSALKHAYRARLRRASHLLRLVFLNVDRDVAAARLAHRPAHFAGPALAQSQFKTLEPPKADDAWIVDASGSIDDTVRELLRRIDLSDRARNR